MIAQYKKFRPDVLVLALYLAIFAFALACTMHLI